jgi:hypothetical protein
MVWTEVEIDRIVSNDHLRAAWADVFGLNIDQVAIVDDITTSNTRRNDRTRLVLERGPQPGDFPLHVMVVLRTGSLAQHKSVPTDPVAAVRTLCAILGCRALISDDDPNPYRWRLVEADKSIRLVRVDPRQLDETGAFVLVPETTEAAA